MKRFVVRLVKEYLIAVDESLTPDDEWRSEFYDYKTLGDIAAHIVWNLEQGFQRVEGLTPEQHKLFNTVIIEHYVESVEQLNDSDGHL